MSKTKNFLTTEEFIRRAKLKHGDRYDYSKTEYNGCHDKVIIICPKHGDFKIEAKSHYSRGSGCQECVNLKKLTTEVFITKAKDLHSNKYDYTKTVYVSSQQKVIITCPKHGDFNVRANMHIHKMNGCPKCVGRNKTELEFINAAKLIHGDKYDYSNLNYTNTSAKIHILCPKHGVFKQMKSSHIVSKKGCPVCSEPKGESYIKQFLINRNINFIKDKRFSDCRNIKPLPFDFYIPDKHILIEFDGMQHFKIIDYFGGKKAFMYQKNLDSIKTNYCLNNNIPLYRIKYDENILEKLSEIFGG